MSMRVLIADRNARLLESIARTFVRQFSIQTATTLEHCNELLLRGGFHLAVVSEKLADGRGLQLLGQITRCSPDTLRIFAVRRSRLELLEGKLGPFGLLRTLAYPIDPQELLSALTLAHAGLERRAGASVPAATPARPTVERITLTSADAMFAINVPMTIASLESVRRSDSSSAPRPAPVARQAAPPTSEARNVAPELQGDAPQSEKAASAARSVAPQLTRPQHPARPSVLSQIEPIIEPIEVDPSFQQQRVHRGPIRTKVVLAAAVVAVFVVTTLTLNMVDASVHITRASAPRPEPAPRPEIVPPAISAPPQSPAPQLRPTPVRPMGQPGRPMGQPKPDTTKAEVQPEDPPQNDASPATPIADPSTFGKETYDPNVY